MRELSGLLVTVLWLGGVVVSTKKILAFIIPPYGMYLAIEFILQKVGWL